MDLGVTLADGGERIADLATLRQQPDLFGQVASTVTAWQDLEAIEGPMLERRPLQRRGVSPRSRAVEEVVRRQSLQERSVLQ